MTEFLVREDHDRLTFQAAAASGKQSRLIPADKSVFNPDPAQKSRVDADVDLIGRQLAKIASGGFGPDYHGVTPEMARQAIPGFCVDYVELHALRAAIKSGLAEEEIQKNIETVEQKFGRDNLEIYEQGPSAGGQPA